MTNNIATQREERNSQTEGNTNDTVCGCFISLCIISHPFTVLIVSIEVSLSLTWEFVYLCEAIFADLCHLYCSVCISVQSVYLNLVIFLVILHLSTTALLLLLVALSFYFSIFLSLSIFFPSNPGCLRGPFWVIYIIRKWRRDEAEMGGSDGVFLINQERRCRWSIQDMRVMWGRRKQEADRTERRWSTKLPTEKEEINQYKMNSLTFWAPWACTGTCSHCI